MRDGAVIERGLFGGVDENTIKEVKPGVLPERFYPT